MSLDRVAAWSLTISVVRRLMFRCLYDVLLLLKLVLVSKQRLRGRFSSHSSPACAGCMNLHRMTHHYRCSVAVRHLNQHRKPFLSTSNHLSNSVALYEGVQLHVRLEFQIIVQNFDHDIGTVRFGSLYSRETAISY